jgi:hypothetical protein
MPPGSPSDIHIIANGRFTDFYEIDVHTSGSEVKDVLEDLQKFELGTSEDPGSGFEWMDYSEANLKPGRRRDLEPNISVEEESIEKLETICKNSRNFFDLRYIHEFWSEREADVDGERKKVMIPEEEDIYTHWTNNYVFHGTHQFGLAKKYINKLKENTSPVVQIKRIEIEPEFLEWLATDALFNHRNEKSFSSIESIRFKSGKEGYRIFESNKSEKEPLKSELARATLPENNLTGISGEIKMNGMRHNMTIQRNRINIAYSDEIDLKLRLKCNKEVVCRVLDMYKNWKGMENKKKYTPPKEILELYNALNTDIKDEKLNTNIEALISRRQYGPVDAKESTDPKPASETNDGLKEEIYQDKTLADLIDDIESQIVEAKKELPKEVDEIAKEAVALANHKGGVIIIGADDDGAIKGVENVQKTNERVSGVVTDSIEPPLNIEVLQRSIGNEDILVVKTEKVTEVPRNVDGKYYKRVGTTKQALGPHELKDIMN